MFLELSLMHAAINLLKGVVFRCNCIHAATILASMIPKGFVFKVGTVNLFADVFNLFNRFTVSQWEIHRANY